MQLFSANATMFLKNHPPKLLIIGPDPFFQYCELDQIQSKSQFLFHKDLPPRDFSIMTLTRRGNFLRRLINPLFCLNSYTIT